MSFIHLRVHSEYSIVDSTIRINDLIARAVEFNMPAVALTDFQNMFGSIKFYKACLKAGIKPIIGTEICVENSSTPTQPYTLILLAKNEIGYRAMCKLLTKAHSQSTPTGPDEIYMPVKPGWMTPQTCDGIIALSGGLSGQIGQALVSDKIDQARQLLEQYQNIFQEGFYLEISSLGEPREDLYFDRVLDLAQAANAPVVATHQPCFLEPDGFDTHELKVCIQTKRSLSDMNRQSRFFASQFLKSPAQMEEQFRDVPGALDNTWEIAQRCNVQIDINATHMPDYPDEIKEDSIDEHLRSLSFTGLRERLGGDIDEPYRLRLETELEIIFKTEFAGYFLIVADIIGWSKREGIAVGPGRGSGAGSLVAYALQITAVDPIRHDLLFERFLNLERVSPPDFDIDFCVIDRERVIGYVAQRYGVERVAQICTYNTMAAKAAVRFVGRAIRPDYLFYDVVARLIPDDLNITLSSALKKSSELRQRYENESRVKELIDKAMELEGGVLNVGKHPAGLVIAPTEITDFTACFTDSESGGEVTHYDKNDLESIGLVKFDFLGLKTLTIIDQTIKTLADKQVSDAPSSDEAIPDYDPKTYETIRSGYTVGIFQLESKGMQRLIHEMQPSEFNDLVALLALFRPGPLQNKMDEIYVENKEKGEFELINEEIRNILKKSHGVILYQEQVMMIAQVMSGYTLGEADILRWAMGKKVKKEMESQRVRFVDGAVEKGYSKTDATRVYDLIESFGGYGFNKSHSVAYALLAYRTAYLKTYFRADFLSTCMTIDTNISNIAKIYSEARKLGIQFHLPDINQSDYGFRALDDHNILWGLGALRKIGAPVVNAIVSARQKKGFFFSLGDFCQRVDLRIVGKAACNSLILSGAFDSFNDNRAQLQVDLDYHIKRALEKEADATAGQRSIFDDQEQAAEMEPAERVNPWRLDKKLKHEHEMMGLYVSGHPVELYAREMSSVNHLTLVSKLTNGHAGAPESSVVFGWVTNLQRTTARRGHDYNLHFELLDSSGEISVTVYWEAVSNNQSEIRDNRPIVVVGALFEDKDGLPPRFNAQAYYDMQWLRKSPAAKLIIELRHGSFEAEAIEQARRALDRHERGAQAIEFRYRSEAGHQVRLHPGHDWRVQISEELLQDLQAHLGEEAVTPDYSNVKIPS